MRQVVRRVSSAPTNDHVQGWPGPTLRRTAERRVSRGHCVSGPGPMRLSAREGDRALRGLRSAQPALARDESPPRPDADTLLERAEGHAHAAHPPGPQRHSPWGSSHAARAAGRGCLHRGGATRGDSAARPSRHPPADGGPWLSPARHEDPRRGASVRPSRSRRDSCSSCRSISARSFAPVPQSMTASACDALRISPDLASITSSPPLPSSRSLPRPPVSVLAPLVPKS